MAQAVSEAPWSAPPPLPRGNTSPWDSLIWANMTAAARRQAALLAAPAGEALPAVAGPWAAGEASPMVDASTAGAGARNSTEGGTWKMPSTPWVGVVIAVLVGAAVCFSIAMLLALTRSFYWRRRRRRAAWARAVALAGPRARPSAVEARRLGSPGGESPPPAEGDDEEEEESGTSGQRPSAPPKIPAVVVQPDGRDLGLAVADPGAPPPPAELGAPQDANNTAPEAPAVFVDVEMGAAAPSAGEAAAGEERWGGGRPPPRGTAERWAQQAGRQLAAHQQQWRWRYGAREGRAAPALVTVVVESPREAAAGDEGASAARGDARGGQREGG